VIEQFDPSLGGVERYAFGLASELVAGGERVTVFTRVPPPAGTEWPTGLTVVPVAVPRGSRARRHARFDAAVRATIGDLRRFDVVQGFGQTTFHNLYRVGGGTHPAYLRAMSAQWPRWKLWFERANPRSRRRIAVERRIFARPGLRLIANSQRTRREVCADYGVEPERIHVIHNFVDHEVFHGGLRGRLGPEVRARWALPREDFVLAAVGSGFPRKGLRHSIAIAAELLRRGVPVRLLVAGRGPVRRYTRIAEQLGMAGRVLFLGRVPQVERVYAAADAFLLPSLYEPFGIAALEALACGLPVVVTRSCGVAEVLTDGREGCLLDRPDDTQRASEFLAGLAADARLRTAFAERAQRRALAFGPKQHAARVLEVYHRVAETRAAGGGAP